MQPNRTLFLGLVIFLILLPVAAQAQNTTCYHGGSLLPNYTLNNATLSSTDILITPDAGNQLASVFFNPTFDPTKNLYVKMVFKITTTIGSGADGMAFVLQNDTRGVNAIGLAGEGIGYGYHTGTPAAPNGEVVIKPSVVVEFDTYYNAARGDPNDTNDITYGHIGLTLNGDPNHADFPTGYLKDLLGTGYRLKSNAPMYAWLDYIASTTTLKVYLNNVNTKPAAPMLTSTVINLATQLGSKFYMGFSGSTGGNQSKHEVMEFYASDSAPLPDTECCNVDADCVSSALGPVCDPQKHVCAQCTIADTSHCAQQPSACDLSGASNTCVPDCDGDYGSTGHTHPCVSANFSFCRLSGPGAGSCEVCAGDYGAGSSPACGLNSPYCSVVGYCGFCTVNTDCTVSGPPHTGVLCNTSNGRCTQCVSSADCANPTPSCIGIACVACNGDYGSATTQPCQNSALPGCVSGSCYQCSSNAQCTDIRNATCDTTSHTCSACNGDYGSGTSRRCTDATQPVCLTSGPSSGACVQCTTAKPSYCTGTTPICDATTDICVTCNGNYGSGQSHACTNAAAPVCLGGACVQCASSLDCTGTTPVCEANVCVACNGDFSSSGHTRPCSLSSAPACNTSGPLTGACTQCSSGNTSLCLAPDQCHQSGACNTTTGLCTFPNKTNGTACDDGNLCTQTDTCQAGTCTGSNPVVCSALDQCHDVGVCHPSTGVCTNPIKTNGTGCNDGNACTQTDTCQSGTCTGSNPVVCSALDQCHDAGVCNTSSGVCSNPNKTDGTACNDGNACTHTDTCQMGVCTGTNPVVCSAIDQCHNVGGCNTTTGVCSNPIKTDGTACNDGSACTITDICQAGTCIGGNPVVCSALDQCHQAGVCDPISSLCSDPIQPNGTTCNDSNACTQTDTCQAGTCSGSNPVVCSALDQCHDAGVCNTSTGLCSNPNKTDGTACNDGDACTHTDTCQSGTCTGTNPVVCSALDQCHDVGVCNTTTGACSNPAKSDGTACSDSNDCTQTDTCQSGACTGTNMVVCPTPDQCHTAGTCDPATGICSNPTQPNGTGCSDGDACTYPDTCQAGTCVAANSIVCVAQDECHDPGSCDPTSGSCSNPLKADDTPCALGLGTCLAGVCKSNDGQPCTDASACTSTYCVDGYCCDKTCAGQCEACNLSGALGHCGAVTGTPQSPRPACTAVDPACAGQCDGTRRIACTYPGTETQCREAQCVDGVATQAESCNGTGACPPIQTKTCDPYVCGPSLCRGDCLVDQDCVSGYFCATGVCQQTLLPGQLCDRNVQCISGHCADNVCCDLPCTGQCEACNLIASPGTCSAVTGNPIGARPSCNSDGGMCSGQCDGQKHDGCSYPGSDQECRPASCQSDLATVRAVCDGAGACPPLHTQPCTPYRCGATQCKGNCVVDEDCADHYWCSAGVCVTKRDPGMDCTGDNECLTGFCADGVCCDAACLSQCQACNVENHLGSCTPVTGAPQPGHAPCAGTGAVCGGSCNGITADRCTYPGAETVCRPASCHVEVDVGIATLQASCDGAGHCPDILQQNCAPYSCNGVVCTQSCAIEPCPNDQYCSAGVCVSKIPQGDTCDSAAHCLSGFCVDGVCCESTCTGQCEACNLDTHVGHCVPVTGVPNGGRAPCVGSGVCQGTCDGMTRNACAFPGSTAICQNGSCSNGIASAAAACDSAGTCGQAAMQSCGAYVCGETTCKTACTTDTDCADAYYCVHSRCADHSEKSGCGCGTGYSDRSGLLLLLLGLVILAIKRRVR